MTPDRQCKLCPLHKSAHTVCLLGAGPRTTDIMVIGEAPGAQEDAQGLPFVGQSGQLLTTLLTSAGFNRRHLFITNAVSCRPPDNRTPTKREIAACSKWLNLQVETIKPRFILTLGNTPLYALTGLTGILKLRGRAIEQGDRIIFPTLHPSAILHAPGLTPLLEQDIREFKRITDHDGIPVEPGVNYTIVDTQAKVSAMLDALTGVVSVDHETTCLYPWAPEAHIVTTGFGTQHAQWNIPLHHAESPWSSEQQKGIIEAATARLHHCVTVYQNGKFDQLWTRAHYGQHWHNDFDTLLAHYLIDENQPHDLEYLAKLYFGAPSWDIPLKEKQGAAPFKTIAHYHAHDLYWTRRLYFRLKQELAKDSKLKRVFTKLLMPLSDLYVEMEHHGCYIDTSRMDEVERQLLKDIAQAEKRLNRWGKIHWGSPKQVAQLLYGQLKIKCPLITTKGNQSTAESALKQIEHPCVQDLLKLRGARQQHSFFIEGWRPYIVNSRIHPFFKLHGTVAGRPSCEHPNFQQVPRDPLIRSLVTAPPGFTIVESDLSQIELRIVAELSKCPAMLHAFHNNKDIHWQTACSALEHGAGGDHINDILETASLYCVQAGLPADRTSTKILLDVWRANKQRESTKTLLRITREAWLDKKPRSGVRRSTDWLSKPLLERRLPDLAEQTVSQETMSALQQYAAHLSASQERKPDRLEKIQFADAMPLLSCIGPSAAEELQKKGVWPQLRTKAKAVGFGFIYGMWWKKFITYARDQYNIKLTPREAQNSRASFFQLYPLENWHKEQHSRAKLHGHVRTLSGRMRRLPVAQQPYDSPERGEALRQAVNAPVQGLASDINLMVLLQAASEFPRQHVHPIITVHDSILLEVRDNWVSRVSRRIEQIMTGPSLFQDFAIIMSVPICGETKIGPWGKGTSLEEWQ